MPEESNKRHLTVLAVILAATVGLAASGADPDKDPQMAKLLQDARRFIDSKNPAAAIPKRDEVIQSLQSVLRRSEREDLLCAFGSGGAWFPAESRSRQEQRHRTYFHVVGCLLHEGLRFTRFASA